MLDESKKNSPIGIIVAMEAEAKDLLSHMQYIKTAVQSGVTFSSGTLMGREVVLAVCGVGKVFAALCAEAMCLLYHPCCLIQTGVAGTLDPAVSIGDIVIADAVLQHDMDTSPLGDPVGLISGINRIRFDASALICEQLFASAKALRYHAVRGVIASGDQFVASAEKKAWIRETFSATACEMEGGAVGQVAFVNQLPFAVVRAISDGGDDEAAMDYPTFVRFAAERSAALLRHAIQNFPSEFML